MIFYLAMLILGPVFYLQGRYVRRVTPVLAEPAGERSGRRGAGSPISLLIVGDSAAAGVGVEHQEEALTGCIVKVLGETQEVTWELLANSGDTSAQLLDRLHHAASEEWATVVVSIGVNDVTALTSGRRWVANLESIIETLRSRFGAQRIYLSSVPPMHEFPALPQPLRWWLGLRARQLNELMASVTARNSDCEFVQVPYVSDNLSIAADGFHPGPHAYQLWGMYVAGLIKGSPSNVPTTEYIENRKEHDSSER